MLYLEDRAADRHSRVLYDAFPVDWNPDLFEIVQMDWPLGYTSEMFEQCRHVRLWRRGVRNGRQRWRCTRCGQSFRDPGGQTRGLALMAELGELFRAGVGVGEAARRGGHDRMTVRSYYAKFIAHAGRGLCKCRKTRFHSGPCRATVTRADTTLA